MKTHTDSYTRLKQQVIELFDFVLGVGYAMPLLKTRIKEIELGKWQKTPLEPDFLKRDSRSPQEIKQKSIANYKSKLSNYLVLSSFSYFEDYVKSVIDEIIEFHGGKTEFVERAKRRSNGFMLAKSADIETHKRKLQEPIKIEPPKTEKYKKHTNALLKLGYRFPSELFSAYGLQVFIRKTKSLKVQEIPELLRDALNVGLDEQLVKDYHSIRDIRNRIAHGERIRLSIRKALEIHNKLHKLAIIIDKHLIEYFYIIEEFTETTSS